MTRWPRRSMSTIGGNADIEANVSHRCRNCGLSGKRLRIEKSLVNTERTGVYPIENEWDFDQ
jgi:hypothetical protein